MQKNYRVARAYLTVTEIFGWLVVAGGLIGVVAAFTIGVKGEGVWSLVAIGLPAAAVGFGIVAAVQLSKAVVDTAENTQEMLKVMAAQPRGGQLPPPTSPVVAPSQVSRTEGPPASNRPVSSTQYRGYTIIRTEAGYEVNGAKFFSLMDAERYIEGLKRS